MPERIACIDVGALALQLFLRAHPEWAGGPAGIVEDARAQAPLLQVNALAFGAGVRVGMPYTAALSVCPHLQVGVLDEVELAAQRQRLAERLMAFSPLVERHPLWGDSYWLRGRGLSGLWESASAWANEMHFAVTMLSLEASVVVGFSQFFTFGVARALRGGVRVFRSPEEELSFASEVPLRALALSEGLSTELSRLGVKRLDALRSLPSGALRRRYGEEAASLSALAREERVLATEVVTPRVSYEAATAWDEPVPQAQVLFFGVQSALSEVLLQVERAGFLCAELGFELTFDWPRYVDDDLRLRAQRAGVAEGNELKFSLLAAEATGDLSVWNTLLRLRLERLALPLAVARVRIEAVVERACARPLDVLEDGARPRPEALLEALAKLRAELGEDRVGHLRLQDAHLPEARQGWVPLENVVAPRPHPHFHPVLVRKMLPAPVLLEAGVEHRAPHTWLSLPASEGRGVRQVGPYVISGAWWHREVERAYYYVHVARGDVLWVYFDRRRQQWFLQARLD